MHTTSLNTIAWRKLKKNKLAFSALLFIIFCAILSIFAPIISPDNSPNANLMCLEIANQKPLSSFRFLEMPKQNTTKVGWLERISNGQPTQFVKIPIDSCWKVDNEIYYIPLSSGIIHKYKGKFRLFEQTFWLGTDKYGRDLLSRMLLGTRISFSVGFIAVLISLLIGISLGLFAGYFRGWMDHLVMWLVNVIWSIPTLLMVIAITLALGKGFWQVFIAVGLTMWVEVTRVVRGQVIGIRELEYVQAGKVLGYHSFRIMFRHILPNIIGPIIVISASNFAAAILLEAGLSFLGIGAQPPMPSWGAMIKDHYAYIIMDKAYLAIIPGFAMMNLVLAFMLLGNGLRDAFDVKDN